MGIQLNQALANAQITDSNIHCILQYTQVDQKSIVLASSRSETLLLAILQKEPRVTDQTFSAVAAKKVDIRILRILMTYLPHCTDTHLRTYLKHGGSDQWIAEYLLSRPNIQIAQNTIEQLCLQFILQGQLREATSLLRKYLNEDAIVAFIRSHVSYLNNRDTLFYLIDTFHVTFEPRQLSTIVTCCQIQKSDYDHLLAMISPLNEGVLIGELPPDLLEILFARLKGSLSEQALQYMFTHLVHFEDGRCIEPLLRAGAKITTLNMLKSIPNCLRYLSFIPPQHFNSDFLRFGVEQNSRELVERCFFAGLRPSQDVAIMAMQRDKVSSDLAKLCIRMAPVLSEEQKMLVLQSCHQQEKLSALFPQTLPCDSPIQAAVLQYAPLSEFQTLAAKQVVARECDFILAFEHFAPQNVLLQILQMGLSQNHTLLIWLLERVDASSPLLTTFSNQGIRPTEKEWLSLYTSQKCDRKTLFSSAFYPAISLNTFISEILPTITFEEFQALPTNFQKQVRGKRLDERETCALVRARLRMHGQLDDLDKIADIVLFPLCSDSNLAVLLENISQISKELHLEGTIAKSVAMVLRICMVHPWHKFPEEKLVEMMPGKITPGVLKGVFLYNERFYKLEAMLQKLFSSVTDESPPKETQQLFDTLLDLLENPGDKSAVERLKTPEKYPISCKFFQSCCENPLYDCLTSKIIPFVLPEERLITFKNLPPVHRDEINSVYKILTLGNKFREQMTRETRYLFKVASNVVEQHLHCECKLPTRCPRTLSKEDIKGKCFVWTSPYHSSKESSCTLV